MNRNSTKNIFVVCPANYATGGPLLLHQLAFKLVQKGLNAKMFYIHAKEGESPVHDFYREMNVPYTTQMEDSTQNTLIIPEVFTSLLFKYPQSKKVIWWLSVDNFLDAIKSERVNPVSFFISVEKYLTNVIYRLKFAFFILYLSIKSFKKRYRERLRLYATLPNLSKKIKSGEYELPQNWVQSHYAKCYLGKIGINNCIYLSDYLDPVFIVDAQKTAFTNENKKNVIAYNPKKGFEVTQRLINASKDIEWVPIENMTPAQVRQLLVEAKVYIDFGNHPGKDRIPREAAISGCIVVTNKKGSANYFEDVPIPDSYKIEYSTDKEKGIIDFFKLCFAEYEQRIKEFETYRKFIENEEFAFNKDLDKIIRQNLSE
jgi:hypothetical protein